MRYWLLMGSLALASTGHAAVHVKDVLLCRDAAGWRVAVKATGKASYTVHPLTSPDRILIDIPDATLDINSRVRAADPTDAPSIRYSQLSRNPDVVRVVVDLPDGMGRWRELSASPAMNIALFLPGGNPSARRVETAAAPRPAIKPMEPAPAKPALAKPAPVKKRHARKNPAPHVPADPNVISARDLEQQMRETGTLPNPAETYTPPPPPIPSRRARRSSVRRTNIASRGGFVDRSDLLAAVTADTAEPVIEPVAPSWSPDEAVALIKSGDCPEPLRKRLIDIVSDPTIQTSRYVWGAETPGQFDCSGLALYIYNGLDVKLPRCSWQQCEVGAPVDRENLRAGDLVFFITRGKNVSHVGIYLGGGRFLHAANPRSNLCLTSLDSPYYARRFAGARRVYGTDESAIQVPAQAPVQAPTQALVQAPSIGG